MSLNTLKYYLREAWTSLLRNSWLSVASMGTIIISLLILGSSLLLMLNVSYLTSTVESSLEITVFLNDGLQQDQMNRLEEEIKFIPGVTSVQFVSRTQALEELRSGFGERADILSGLDKDNPLPDSFRVKTREAEQVPAAAQQLSAISGVEQVRYGQGVVEKLLALTHWVRLWGSITIILLALAAIFLISTSIRMSLYARRREIAIMKMLGATNFFVRMPFMLEGMLLGLVGALVAALVINFGYLSLLSKVIVTLPFIQMITDPVILYRVLGGMLGLGFIIGALGSAISLHRFLRV
ncbi:MAG: permease-like cell division protein FtsX [Firmicutes bacterium]|nr:permease-like cell division protein FtsX [Bacillota bacterium]